jgi:hypothetical protein
MNPTRRSFLSRLLAIPAALGLCRAATAAGAAAGGATIPDAAVTDPDTITDTVTIDVAAYATDEPMARDLLDAIVRCFRDRRIRREF